MRKLALVLAIVLAVASPAFGQILSLPANPTFQNLFLQSGGFIDWGSPGAPGDNRLTHTLGAGLRLTGSAPTLNLGTGLVGDPGGILTLNSFSAAINRPITIDAAAKKISLPSDLLIEGTSTSLRYWDGAAYRTGFSLQSGSGGINLPTQVSQEKVVNGDFTVCPGAWTLGADWSCGAGVVNKAATGVTTLEQNVAAAANELYLLQQTLVFTVTTGGLTPSIGGTAGTNRSASGTYREYICAAGAGNLIFTPGNALSVISLDNVSATQVGTCAADTVALWVQDVNGVAGSAGVHIRDELGRLFRFGNGALYLGASGDTASAISLTPSVGALTLAGGQLLFPAGTASLPAIGWTADSTTGFFSVGGGVTEYSSGGTLSLTFGADRIFFGAALDLALLRESAATLKLGENSATPVGQTIKGADARAGTDTNTVGGDFTGATGRGTGTGTPGRGYLTGTVKTGGGSGAQTLAEVASWGSPNGVNRGFRYLTDVYSQAGAGALAVGTVNNSLIRVTAAGTVTLPAGTVVGQTVSVVSTTAAVVSLDPDSASDYLILNGTALAGGNKATSDGTIGAMLSCVNEVANYFRCQAVQGVWSDGGA
jgi:hypothetical protein